MSEESRRRGGYSRLPLHGAKSIRLEIKALKLCVYAKTYTLNHSLSHRAACSSALISQAAVVWPKKDRVRDNREKTDQSLVLVTSFCRILAGLSDTSAFPHTCG